MIKVETIIQALAAVWAIEEEHETKSYADLLARLEVEDPELLLSVVSQIAHRILEERPDIADKPDVIAGFGVAWGLATGLRAAKMSAE